MTVRAHQITASQVRALAEGTSTSAELEILLRSQRSKVLAMLELVTRKAAESRHPDAPATLAGRELLARVARQAPAAAEEVMRYPAVGAWAAATLLTLDSRRRAPGKPGFLALVAAAAAIRGGVESTVELPASECAGPVLHLPSLGGVALPRSIRGGSAVLRHHGGRTEIARGQEKVILPAHLAVSTGGWRALLTVSAGSPGNDELRLVVDDEDRYRLPGYGGDLVRLSGGDGEVWRRRTNDGWRLLARHHEPTAGDVRALIRAVTPLSAADGARRSVTSRHAFGAVGLSLPEDGMAMALTLAHEVQHAKLCALMDLLPLVSDHDHRLFYAPWRPDPRPLASLLQGMYAHLGVARFWRRQREVAGEPAEIHRAHVEFDRWRTACTQVAAVVSARPELTAHGAVFVDGMARLVRSWRGETVPPTARAEARQAVRDHWKRWGACSPSQRPSKGCYGA